MYEPKKGDHVRVVLEGKVKYLHPYGGGGFMLNTNGIYPDHEHVVSIEKIEPPVEVFKPGDVVRHKFGNLYTLGRDGFIEHGSRKFFEYKGVEFTSEWYERVEIPSAP